MSAYTKSYLGDGAYVEWDEYQGLILTTENGVEVTNTIVLGGEEYKALVAFVERIKKYTKEYPDD